MTSRGGSRRVALIVLIVAGVTMADLVIKRIVESTLGDGRTIAGTLVDLRLTYNTGVAFSVGAALPTWIVVAGTGTIIAVGATYLLRRAARINLVAAIGGAVLLGGALGNLIDRMDGKGVVDYFHTGWFATFNLADVFVTVGVAVLVAGLWWSPPSVSPGRSSSPS